MFRNKLKIPIYRVERRTRGRIYVEKELSLGRDLNDDLSHMLLRLQISIGLNGLVEREDFVNDREGLLRVCFDEAVHRLESG